MSTSCSSCVVGQESSVSDEVPGSSGSWDTGVTGCSGRGCTEGGPFAEVVLKGGCGIFDGSRAPFGAAEAVRAGIRVAKKEKKVANLYLQGNQLCNLCF